MIRRVVSVIVLAGAVSAAPALANGFLWGGGHHGLGSSSTSSGASTPAGSSSGGANQVPEPADAALFMLGVAGVALGRRFRPRKKG